MSLSALTAADLSYENLLTDQRLNIGGAWFTLTKVTVVPLVGEREAYEKPVALNKEKLGLSADATVLACYPVTGLQEKANKKSYECIVNTKQELVVYGAGTAKKVAEELLKAESEALKEYYVIVATVGR